MFASWHGWVLPRAPVCLDGCFYTCLSSPAIGRHPHMNVPPNKSRKTHSHAHFDTCTELLGWMRWRRKLVKKRSSCPSSQRLFPGNVWRVMGALKLASKSDISNINFVMPDGMVAVCALTFEQLIKQKLFHWVDSAVTAVLKVNLKWKRWWKWHFQLCPLLWRSRRSFPCLVLSFSIMHGLTYYIFAHY